MCVEESDYRILIQKLEDDLTRSSFSSYHESMLAGLYAKIVDTDSQLAVLESGLEYGTHYWRLAVYWCEIHRRPTAEQQDLAGVTGRVEGAVKGKI